MGNERTKHRTPAWLVLIAVVFAAVLVTAGYIAVRELGQDMTWRLRVHRAEENAVAWVREKYGIEAKPVETEIAEEGALFDRWQIDWAFVTMEAEGRTFKVSVSAKEGDLEGAADTYQAEDITQAAAARVQAVWPGAAVKSFDFGTDDSDCIAPYFDGEDLGAVLPETASLEMVTTEELTCTDAQLDALEALQMDISVYQFADAAQMEGYLASPAVGADDYAPYIASYRTIGSANDAVRQYDLRETDGMLYGLRWSALGSLDGVTVAPCDAGQLGWLAEGDSGGARVPVTQAWKIPGDCPDLTVWYPLASIPHSEDHTIYIAYRKTSARGETSVLMHEYRTAGEYAVFDLPQGKDIQLVFVDTGWPAPSA